MVSEMKALSGFVERERQHSSTIADLVGWVEHCET